MERIFAQTPAIANSVDIKDIFQPASSYTSIGDFVSMLLKNALTVGGVIFLVLLIFGGFTFIVSAGGGDAKKAEQSKKTITAAVTGFVIIFAAYWIIQIIEIITGISILKK